MGASVRGRGFPFLPILPHCGNVNKVIIFKIHIATIQQETSTWPGQCGHWLG